MEWKYVSKNCLDLIALESVYIEKAIVEKNNLYLTFENIELLSDHPLNKFGTEWDTNGATLVFYDFEVLESGFYECKDVQKQELVIEDDCTFIPIQLFELLKDFTVVSEELKNRTVGYFEHYFGGFAWSFNEEWGCFKIRYKSMEACWNSFYNNS